jgi:DNA-binding CsgD family transcriptional regulator
MDFDDFVERTNNTNCLNKLFCLLVEAAEYTGFGQLAYGALTHAELPRLVDHPKPAIALNYPSHWQNHYMEHNYRYIDPVVIYAPFISGPFLWDQLAIRYNLNRKQLQLLNEAREAGLKNGITVPLHGPSGKVAVVSFASRFDDADPRAQLGRLNALASQFHVVFTNLAHGLQSNVKAVNLSSREKDCLNWVAHGKTSWEISVILDINRNTVDFHIKNAMNKLEATNRIAAVFKAIRLGLIDPPHL